MIFIFKENDRELGFADLSYVLASSICDISKTIELILNGTSKILISFTDVETCISEHCRLITEIQILGDNAEDKDYIFLELDDDD